MSLTVADTLHTGSNSSRVSLCFSVKLVDRLNKICLSNILLVATLFTQLVKLFLTSFTRVGLIVTTNIYNPLV